MRHIAAACDTSLQHAANLVHFLKTDRARLVDLTPLDRRAGFEACELQRTHALRRALCRVQHDTLHDCTALHCAHDMRECELQRTAAVGSSLQLSRPLRAALWPRRTAQHSTAKRTPLSVAPVAACLVPQ